MAQRVRDSGSHAGWMPERVSASMHGMAAAQCQCAGRIEAGDSEIRETIMLVVSIVAQCLFLFAAVIASARLTIRSRSIAAGGLRLYGFFILWAILFCVVVPAVFTGLMGRSEVIAVFPDAIGVVPVICLSWIHAFAFAGLVRLIHWGMTRWAGAGRVPRFEDYSIQTGYTNVGHLPHASIEEFFSLAATGSTPEEAVENLRKRFEERVNLMMGNGERIPRPGSGRARPRFAPTIK